MNPKSKKENCVLPERYCIKGCKELSEYFSEFGLNNRNRKQRSGILYPLGGDCEDKYYFMIQYPSWDFNSEPEGDIITFEQFKDHVLKEKESEFNSTPDFEGDVERFGKVEILDKSEWKEIAKTSNKYHLNSHKSKEIIGYKLVKEEYKSVFCHIMDTKLEYIKTSNRYPFHFSNECESYDKMVELNLLNVWCEPVYKPETITLKSGVELSESDIDEVKELIEIRKICKSLANEDQIQQILNNK